jgi:hypothetical protein
MVEGMDCWNGRILENHVLPAKHAVRVVAKTSVVAFLYDMQPAMERAKEAVFLPAIYLGCAEIHRQSGDALTLLAS